ncbi:hypothetical protein B0T16DRAFT_386656 [Cercophora newfieldiana]|uniref:Uncharacterized protein n=1 Tax=Cercophora newfieldiana TaxID=92897 RepID=A0AA39YF31_9PEZI|nr:hypothetical protein B0T16DRAFT_386656 [Cercophora newfieldiana]
MVQITTLIALLASSGFLFVSGTPLAAPRSLVEEGYTASPIYWKGVLEEGKPEFELSGYSFEEIEAEAKAINPEYTIFLKDGQANDTAAEDHPALSARQTPSTWRPAPDAGAVYQGVSHLRGIAGNCRANPGPGVCSRVSCSWDSAIFYCNDNNVEHWEPCRWIGDVANGIAPYYSVHGQAFD